MQRNERGNGLRNNSSGTGLAVTILDYVKKFLLIFAGIIAITIIARLWFIYEIYQLFLGLVMGYGGLDIMIARGVGALLSVVAIMTLPWMLSFALFGRKKKQVLTVGSIIFAVFCASIYYGTNDVFFDRRTGEPLKYYIKTLDGFKFSSTADIDPTFGIQYKPMTAEIAKEYYLWQSTGELGIPEVVEGEYFDRLTGEPKAWYIERSETSIELFSLPGFDPLTGEKLKPIKVNTTLLKTGKFTIANGRLLLGEEAARNVKKVSVINDDNLDNLIRQGMLPDEYQDKTIHVHTWTALNIRLDDDTLAHKHCWDVLVKNEKRAGFYDPYGSYDVSIQALLNTKQYTTLLGWVRNNSEGSLSAFSFHTQSVFLFNTSNATKIKLVNFFFTEKREGDINEQGKIAPVIELPAEGRKFAMVFPAIPTDELKDGKILFYINSNYIQLSFR